MQKFLTIHHTHLVLNVCGLALLVYYFMYICFPKVIIPERKKELAFTEHLPCEFLYFIYYFNPSSQGHKIDIIVHNLEPKENKTSKNSQV